MRVQTWRKSMESNKLCERGSEFVLSCYWHFDSGPNDAFSQLCIRLLTPVIVCYCCYMLLHAHANTQKKRVSEWMNVRLREWAANAGKREKYDAHFGSLGRLKNINKGTTLYKRINEQTNESFDLRSILYVLLLCLIECLHFGWRLPTLHRFIVSTVLLIAWVNGQKTIFRFALYYWLCTYTIVQTGVLDFIHCNLQSVSRDLTKSFRICWPMAH